MHLGCFRLVEKQSATVRTHTCALSWTSPFNTCLREWKWLSLYIFYRIIFLLLIVSSLSCNFNRCAVCFQSFSEHRLQKVLKMPRVSNAFEDYRSKKSLNKKITIINSLLCWNVTLLMFIQTRPQLALQKWLWKFFFNCLAKGPHVLRSIVLNIEWVHFVLQNCEILHSAWGLYDKNSPSWYCFTSNVMFKKYKRLVYTSPDLLSSYQEPLWLLNVIEDDC